MNTQYYTHNRVATAAGTNANYIVLPAGSRLVLASARNFTKSGQRVQLILCDASKNPGSGNPPTALSKESLVLGNLTQDGVNDSLCWSGDTGQLNDSLRTLIALFWNCDVADELILTAGIAI